MPNEQNEEGGGCFVTILVIILAFIFGPQLMVIVGTMVSGFLANPAFTGFAVVVLIASIIGWLNKN